MGWWDSVEVGTIFGGTFLAQISFNLFRQSLGQIFWILLKLRIFSLSRPKSPQSSTTLLLLSLLLALSCRELWYCTVHLFVLNFLEGRCGIRVRQCCRWKCGRRFHSQVYLSCGRGAPFIIVAIIHRYRGRRTGHSKVVLWLARRLLLRGCHILFATKITRTVQKLFFILISSLTSLFDCLVDLGSQIFQIPSLNSCWLMGSVVHKKETWTILSYCRLINNHLLLLGYLFETQKVAGLLLWRTSIDPHPSCKEIHCSGWSTLTWRKCRNIHTSSIFSTAQLLILAQICISPQTTVLGGSVRLLISFFAGRFRRAIFGC